MLLIAYSWGTFSSDGDLKSQIQNLIRNQKKLWVFRPKFFLDVIEIQLFKKRPLEMRSGGAILQINCGKRLRSA